MSEVLRCIGITKSFGNLIAVSRLSIWLKPGQILALLGSSGCGKTTTLRLIAGFELPDEGTIEIGGQTVCGDGIFIPPEKRQVGMVFQDYALFPHLTVSENIAFGLGKGKGKTERVHELLSLVGLPGFESRMPYELSGGQQQRVSLARALAPKPHLLLLDEPFSNLESGLRIQIREEVRSILKNSSTSAIFVTHDQEEAFFMGDTVAIMNHGRIEQVDIPYQIYHNPTSSFVAKFVGEADFLPARVTDEGIATELGNLLPQKKLDNHDHIEIMVRPDDVSFTPSETGQGVIISSTFQGAFYIYRIVLNSGTVVHSLQLHTVKLDIGTRVKLSFDPHYSPIYFRNGYRVG